MSNLYRGPSIDASYQFQFIWESGLRGEEIFRNQPIRNKNGLWCPCLLMDQEKLAISVEDFP
jgi:hypothetical protein